MYFHTPEWDLATLFLINQQWRGPLLDFAMPLFSSSAALFTLGAAIALVAAWRRNLHVSVVLGLGLTLLVSNQVCDFVKSKTDRARPYHSVSGTWFHDSGTWVQRPTDATPRTGGSSYPSAHSANAAAAALFLHLIFRKKIIWLLPMLVGYSRVYLGKHFPSDVLMGWMLGLAVASVLVPLYPEFRRRLFSLWMRYRLRV